MAEEKLDIVVKLVDEASQSLKKIKEGLDDVGSSAEESTKTLSQKLDGLSSGFSNFGSAMLPLSVAVAALGIGALKTAGDFEQMRVAFDTMTGSAENGQRLLTEMLEFAQKTPFTIPGVREATQRLLAYGVEQDLVIPQLKVLGDIAAGVGEEKLPFLTLAFGQVQASGRLTGQELRQFTEAGVDLQAALAGVLGVSVETVAAMDKTTISADQVNAALITLVDEGGKFENLMDKQSETLSGQFSNALDSVTIALASLGEQFIPIATAAIEKFIDVVEIMTDWFSKLTPEIKNTIAFVGVFVAALGPGALLISSVIKVMSAWIPVIKGLGIALNFLALNPIGIVITVIAALLFALRSAGVSWKQIWDGMLGVVEFFVTPFTFFIDQIIRGLNQLFNLDLKTTSEGFDSLRAAVGNSTEQYGPFIDEIDNSQSMLDKLKASLDLGGGGLEDFGDSSGSAAEKVSEAFDEMTKSAQDFGNELNDALEESAEKIADIEQQLSELIIGKIEDTNDERMNLAQAYVDQQDEVAKLQQDLLEETDEAEREILQNEISRLQENLDERATIELSFAEELKKIREDAEKTNLDLALDAFQENIRIIEQEFDFEYGKLLEKLENELTVQTELLRLKAEASAIAQGFIIDEETTALESIDRQIDAYNQLAQAVQNARQGITTAAIDFGATEAAREAITTQQVALVTEEAASTQEVATTTEGATGDVTNNVINLTIDNTTVLSSDDVVEQIGDPLMDVMKQHFALV